MSPAPTRPTYLYKLGAGSEEHCPTAILTHHQHFSPAEFERMVTAAECEALRRRMPDSVAAHERLMAHYLERADQLEQALAAGWPDDPEVPVEEWLLDMSKAFPDRPRSWEGLVESFRQRASQQWGESYESLFDDTVEALCARFGFRSASYVVTLWRDAWATVVGVTQCPSCGQEILDGTEFGGPASHRLSHLCPARP